MVDEVEKGCGQDVRQEGILTDERAYDTATVAILIAAAAAAAGVMCLSSEEDEDFIRTAKYLFDCLISTQAECLSAVALDPWQRLCPHA